MVTSFMYVVLHCGSAAMSKSQVWTVLTFLYTVHNDSCIQVRQSFEVQRQGHVVKLFLLSR